MKSTINAWISFSVKFQIGSSYWINTPIEDAVFMSSTGDGGNTFSTSSSKIYKGLGIILQGKVSTFFYSVILIPWVQLFESQLVLTMD